MAVQKAVTKTVKAKAPVSTKTVKKTVKTTPASRSKQIKKVGVAVKSAPGVKMSPGERLAAARAAKANGTAPARKKVVRKPIPTWAAPADFKPHFVEVTVRTEKDGLLGNAIKAIRVNGRYDFEDPGNIDERKKFDLVGFDRVTLIGIQARLAAVTFKATNDKKFPVDPKGRTEVKGAMRLPANTTFRMVLRINKNKDGFIAVGIKQILQAVKNAKGIVKPVALDKKDPVYRALRKCSRIMPGAFKDIQSPPAKTRRKKVEDDGEE